MRNLIRIMIFAGFRLGGFLLRHLSPELAVVKIHLDSVPDIEPQSRLVVETERRALSFYYTRQDLVLMSHYIGRVDQVYTSTGERYRKISWQERSM